MDNTTRRQQARAVRESAADLAAQRPHPRHRNNGDESRLRRWLPEKKTQQPSYLGNFTKGLPHHPHTGLTINPADYQQFIDAIDSGAADDIARTPLGPPISCRARHAGLTPTFSDGGAEPKAGWWRSAAAKDVGVLNPGTSRSGPADVRAWESQSAGLQLDLQGPDAQANTMPPAPAIGSDELAAEMAEVYLMALMRDVHVSHLRDASQGPVVDPRLRSGTQCTAELARADAQGLLEPLDWFNADRSRLDPDEAARHRGVDALDDNRLFRGVFKGDDQGPYLSQFLLLGDGQINPDDPIKTPGTISYGAQQIDLRVRIATPCRDYMTTWEAWLDVQNGADLRRLESYLGAPDNRRLPTTPRDLATYVHYDALYQAYLNAALYLLGSGAPFDPGLPFQGKDSIDKQQGFAAFGGPHLLTLCTEVATRALKAVRYQKFNVHRRLRPEALAGAIDRVRNATKARTRLAVKPLADTSAALTPILERIARHNARQNKAPDRAPDPGSSIDSYLLPMAFAEGSPMHPCYGAGHATVAGACTTILKAWFDHGHQLLDEHGHPIAKEPCARGETLVDLQIEESLTVEGELNKLAANISIGRNWAGVHFFSDYIESMRLGEEVAIGLLEEQRLCYGENFRMSVPLLDGGVLQI